MKQLALQSAIKLCADPLALNALGLLQIAQGFVEDAVISFRRSIEMDAQNPHAHSNLLLAMNYVPSFTRQDMSDEHRRWADRFEAPLESRAGRLPTTVRPNDGCALVMFRPIFAGIRWDTSWRR